MDMLAHAMGELVTRPPAVTVPRRRGAAVGTVGHVPDE